MIEDSIFAAAVQKANVAERAAFLDGACGGDTALRARIEQRIAAAEQTQPVPAHLDIAVEPEQDAELHRLSIAVGLSGTTR